MTLSVNPQKVFNFNSLMQSVSKKLHREIRDYANSWPHFNQWCELTGKGELDPEGKSRGNSQLWYAEYNNHPEGSCKRPPYLDFWHWWLDRHTVSNGSTEHGVNFKEILNSFVMESEYDASRDYWIVEILNTFILVLKSNGHQDISVLYEW